MYLRGGDVRGARAAALTGGRDVCSSGPRHPREGSLPPCAGRDHPVGGCPQDGARPVAAVAAVVPAPPVDDRERQRLILTPAQRQMILVNVRRLRELREEERAARGILAREPAPRE
ncbi:hypothetical protein KW843_22195 [Acidovorax sp. sif1233]|uniref:hypothetical protein n=1 Tax=Acidovorax sp. sif1233 TaxID=2854792 RepID=UPI001C43A46A|nr:hypothetical protein [Acidovorax sp. sif1233]MBV7457209.1 hypothetical protein [Acidovorax sp. sif1233]